MLQLVRGWLQSWLLPVFEVVEVAGTVQELVFELLVLLEGLPIVAASFVEKHPLGPTNSNKTYTVIVWY